MVIVYMLYTIYVYLFKIIRWIIGFLVIFVIDINIAKQIVY